MEIIPDKLSSVAQNTAACFALLKGFPTTIRDIGYVNDVMPDGMVTGSSLCMVERAYTTVKLSGKTLVRIAIITRYILQFPKDETAADFRK